MNPDLLNQAERLKIIDEITSAENISRKRYEQRKLDVYRNRQASYVLERLVSEFSADTVAKMRKVLSINPATRIVNQLGSIYLQEPERHWSNTSGEEQEKALEDFYRCCGFNPQMRVANRYYKLFDQCALYIVPKAGKIQPRALPPHYYDVIPDSDNPELAYAYVLNVFDSNLYGPRQTTSKEQDNRYYSNSRTPKDISNDSDREKVLQRFIWWTAGNHFTTNGKAQIVPEGPIIDNPIQRLPFIDIATEKDYQFFVKRGNDIVEFVIDLLIQLSDLAEISRLQGYSQAVIYSIDEPRALTVGPNKVMWIKQPPAGEQSQPKFAFESPSPDLKNSLEIINVQLKMFLSCKGLDASTVSGDTPKRAFTSGIDHLLANIDKFQASQEDFDLFRQVEVDAFDITRAWSNEYQSVTGEDQLKDVLKIGQISEDVALEIKFTEPVIVESKKDKEDSVIKRWDNDLLTTKDALKELYGFDDDKADAYLLELKQDRVDNPRPAVPGLGNPGTETPPKLPPGTGPADPNAAGQGAKKPAPPAPDTSAEGGGD